MGIVAFIILVAIIGFLTWLVCTYVPMPAQVKTFLPIAVIVLLVLVLLGMMGLLNYDVPIPKLR